MNGAESLIRTSVAAGVEVCFANPGTTEMPLVAALDSVPGVRAVLGLFEGVCTGAADGYGRMTGRPALTLLHLGPGFANGIANLHNARRAHSPIVNLIGDQATAHLPFDAPLTSDIDSLARPVSGWVRTTTTAHGLAADAAEAVAAATHPPGQVASLIVPADCQWGDAEGPARPLPAVAPAAVDNEALAAAESAVRAGESTVLLLGGAALGERGLRAAQRIAAGSGCKIFMETFNARVERGGSLPDFPRLPYFPEQAMQALAGAHTLVLAGAIPPVAFFAYPGVPSRLEPEGCAVTELARREQDVAGALEALADRVGSGTGAAAPRAERPAIPTAPDLNPDSLARTLLALQPDGAIVVDEAATTGLAYGLLGGSASTHTVLSLTGGAIGQGLPCATGAAIACPDRRVIAFEADGSGLYTLQALWTQAREQLDVTTIVCANRAYRILQVELARAGVAEAGPQARALTNLAQPEIEWASLARGFGVPGTRVESVDQLAEALRRSFAEPGPALIEALL